MPCCLKSYYFFQASYQIVALCIGFLLHNIYGFVIEKNPKLSPGSSLSQNFFVTDPGYYMSPSRGWWLNTDSIGEFSRVLSHILLAQPF